MVQGTRHMVFNPHHLRQSLSRPWRKAAASEDSDLCCLFMATTTYNTVLIACSYDETRGMAEFGVEAASALVRSIQAGVLDVFLGEQQVPIAIDVGQITLRTHVESGKIAIAGVTGDAPSLAEWGELQAFVRAVRAGEFDDYVITGALQPTAQS